MALLSTFNSMFRNRVSSLFLVAIILSATLPIFVGCGRERIVFEDGEKILVNVRGDGISEYTVPEGVTSISAWAFDECKSLTSITIPDSVTSIDEEAFFGPSQLTQILVSDGNPNFKSIDGVLFSADGKILIRVPAAKPLTEYTVPDGVTSISEWAFHECKNLTSLTIPDSVTSIRISAFRGCENLEFVNYPASMHEFFYCVKTLDGSYSVSTEASSGGTAVGWNQSEGVLYE